MPKSRLRWCALISVLLIGGAAFYHLSSGAAHKGGKGEEQIPVMLASATEGTLPDTISALGTVRPRNVVTLRARVDGAITALPFREGDLVRQGQVIAHIDARPYAAALRQAEAQLMRDRATMANVAVDKDRAVKLAEIGAGPDQAAKTLSSQLQAAHATLAADMAAVDAARLNLSFTTITAPTSGRVGQRLVGVGSVVRASDLTGIATITQIDPIDVQFPLSEDRLGEAVKAHRDGAAVTVLTRDGAGQLAGAKLDFLDNEVQQGTGQFIAKAQITSGAEQLWPGQLVSVRIALGMAKGVVVPRAAVQGSGDEAYVYVVTNGKAQIRPVRITLSGMDKGIEKTVIASGLKVGEEVVVDGQSRLKAGAKVVAANSGKRESGQ